MSESFPILPRKKFEDYPALPDDVLKERLDSLLVAMGNKIDREWPARWSGQSDAKILLFAIVRINENTYKSVRYLCADIPSDPFRRLEFAVSVPPLARTILDSIFTVVFLFQDLPERIKWYVKSGWRELYEEHERYKRKYGNDPHWTDWLDKQEWFVEFNRKDWGISPLESADLRIIPRWPNPGKMHSDKKTAQDRREYLVYLNDWFYRALSSDAHLSWPGMARRAAHFLHDNQDAQEELLKKYRSDCVMTTIILVVALLSELEMELRYDLSERLKFVWGILKEYWGEAQELYDRRYSNNL